MVRFEQLQERATRIETRRDDRCRNLVAVFQHHARSTPAAQQHFRHAGVAADLSAEGARSGGDRFTERAGATLGEAPRAEHAVQLAHVMMERSEEHTSELQSSM